MSKMIRFLCLTLICFNCADSQEEQKRFALKPSTETGISFVNQLTESDSLNYFKYPYLYMGGGVAIADFDNDGLQDIYFTGNMVANRLYKNKGNLTFEDVSQKAGVLGLDSKWYTGVSIIDINQDGYVDIYCSVSGMGNDKANELYVNNGDFSFTERAQQYGLADNGNTVQTYFLDFDNDGDMDVFTANYPITNFNTSNFEYKMLIYNPTREKSNHLFMNQGDGKFVDVTNESGLLSFGLTLSASLADYNNDGLVDIYLSNDFSTPDNFYINNGDNTFSDHLQKITKQTSFYGMGSDAADINNDGLMDLVQVDMTPDDNRRSKTNMSSMNPALFWSTVNSGFHYQYMYNSLQVNRGIVGGLPVMSNVAWIGGISSTDWSWAPLLADFDNDGYKDLFVANGTRKEINNRDYFIPLDGKLDKATDAELKNISDGIPFEKVDNFIFKNNSGEGFSKVNADWGMEYEGFSNGAAYADLDNDGDLDLVINNIDDLASVFENKSTELENSNYLRVNLQESNQTNIYGTEIIIYLAGKMQKNILNPVRGFQSSVERIIHFGIGQSTLVDSLHVIRKGKLIAKRENVHSNQVLSINVSQTAKERFRKKTTSLLEDKSEDTFNPIHWSIENSFDDFKIQILLPHQMSNFGPALAVGDVDGDGLDDVYVGGAVGSRGVLYKQNMSNQLISSWVCDDSQSEDLSAEFFDYDNDGDLDLYVVSGGNEYKTDSPEYQDRLYINDQGQFTKSKNILPNNFKSGSSVAVCDYDNDGDLDLFIGTRLSPWNYPFSEESQLLENRIVQGENIFLDVSNRCGIDMNLGMVTDALWTDINNDGDKDLIVVGEWMGIKIFHQTGGVLEDKSHDYLSENTTGWWFSIEEGDLDNDGDIDFVLGNLGLNYKYQATKKAPFRLYADDFDGNKKKDIILSYYNKGTEYPVRGRQCSSQQIPAIQVAYKDYKSFSIASTEDIFGTEKLKNSYSKSVESFASIILENKGTELKIHQLPYYAQISSINDIVVSDITGDGILDIAIGGGLYASEVETPRNDASIGLVMQGLGGMDFSVLSLHESGFYVPWDMKKMKAIVLNNKLGYVTASNKGPVQVFLKR